MSDEKQKVDLRDVYTEKTKETKLYLANWLKRYGYWAMIVALFALSIMFSILTVGDVYRRNDTSFEEILEKYTDAGHIITDNDKVIISDIVVEAFSKDEVIDYNVYNKLLERIQSFNYKDEDRNVRFDVIAFYLYQKETQTFISFKNFEPWRLSLTVLNVCLSILTTIVFMQTGLQDGLSNSMMIDKRESLQKISLEAAKYRFRSAKYFNALHAGQLDTLRRNFMRQNGLKYEDYFLDGALIKDVKIKDDEKRVVNAAIRINVSQLSYDKVATLSQHSNDVGRLNGIKHYKTTKASTSIAVKSLLAVLFMFVSVSLVVSAQSKMQIFLNVMSSIFVFIAGFLEYLNAYSFIVDDYAETIDSRIRHLEAMISFFEKEDEDLLKLRGVEMHASL